MVTEKALELIRARDPEFLRAIFNHHFQLTGLLDADGRMLLVNETALKLVGAAEAQVLNKYFWETPWWTHSTALQARLRKAMRRAAAGEFVRFEAEHLNTEGVRRIVDFSLSPLRDEHGRVKYLIPEARDITELKSTERALQQALAELEELKEKLQEENIYLKEQMRLEQDLAGMVGRSATFQTVLDQIEQVARTDATVLVLGETGTGKELVARAIHERSRRRDGPLVRVNCAALPASLVESELFGHEKGAFTGALKRKPGRFELADGGTLFLDEIGDLPVELQAKLLRVLQEYSFERVGGSHTIDVDIRVIAATNRNLEKRLADNEFRQDLYYRLNVFRIECPALRERRDDIPDLVHYFVDRHSARFGKTVDKVPASVMRRLQAYHWPGNVRELENIIERALIVSRANVLEIGDWFVPDGGHGEEQEVSSLQEVEKRHICRTLELTGWRVSGAGGAADRLGLKPTTLEARMKKLGIRRARG